MSTNEELLDNNPNQDESKKGRKPKKSSEELEKEALELLDRVGSGVIDSLRDRVAYILNRYADARNSDIELVWLYWQIFESEKYPGDYITKDHMYALSRVPSLVRERARIQNQYKLFQADDVQRIPGYFRRRSKRASG